MLIQQEKTLESIPPITERDDKRCILIQARANLLDVMLASSESSSATSSSGSAGSDSGDEPPDYRHLHRLHRYRRQKKGI